MAQKSFPSTTIDISLEKFVDGPGGGGRRGCRVVLSVRRACLPFEEGFRLKHKPGRECQKHDPSLWSPHTSAGEGGPTPLAVRETQIRAPRLPQPPTLERTSVQAQPQWDRHQQPLCHAAEVLFPVGVGFGGGEGSPSPAFSLDGTPPLSPTPLKQAPPPRASLE